MLGFFFHLDAASIFVYINVIFQYLVTVFSFCSVDPWWVLHVKLRDFNNVRSFYCVVQDEFCCWSKSLRECLVNIIQFLFFFNFFFFILVLALSGWSMFSAEKSKKKKKRKICNDSYAHFLKKINDFVDFWYECESHIGSGLLCGVHMIVLNLVCMHPTQSNRTDDDKKKRANSHTEATRTSETSVWPKDLGELTW